MKKNRDQRFAEAMGGMAELLKGNLSEIGLRAWDKQLAEFPIEVIERAAWELSGSAQFFPVPAEMKAACRKIRRDMEYASSPQKAAKDRILAGVKAERELRPMRKLLEAVNASDNPLDWKEVLFRRLGTPKVIELVRPDYDARIEELKTQARQMLDDARKKKLETP